MKDGARLDGEEDPEELVGGAGELLLPGEADPQPREGGDGPLQLELGLATLGPGGGRDHVQVVQAAPGDQELHELLEGGKLDSQIEKT